jgi:hypothetical protein
MRLLGIGSLSQWVVGESRCKQLAAWSLRSGNCKVLGCSCVFWVGGEGMLSSSSDEIVGWWCEGRRIMKLHSIVPNISCFSFHYHLTVLQRPIFQQLNLKQPHSNNGIGVARSISSHKTRSFSFNIEICADTAGGRFSLKVPSISRWMQFIVIDHLLIAPSSLS